VITGYLAQARCTTSLGGPDITLADDPDAERLNPGGVFVVEAFVPDVARFDRLQRVHVHRIEPGASTPSAATTRSRNESSAST
jgi:hypothetical protein